MGWLVFKRDSKLLKRRTPQGRGGEFWPFFENPRYFGEREGREIGVKRELEQVGGGRVEVEKKGKEKKEQAIMRGGRE